MNNYLLIPQAFCMADETSSISFGNSSCLNTVARISINFEQIRAIASKAAAVIVGSLSILITPNCKIINNPGGAITKRVFLAGNSLIRPVGPINMGIYNK